jgi:glutamate-ammonia-ligase adenylyltransferase
MESEARVFQDEETARRSLSHLESLLGEPLDAGFEKLFAGNADPDLALVNLGRWLAATANPQVHLQQLVALPRLALLLVTILGASQPITDSLIQNPELASLILDPAELGRYPTRDLILAEGKSMLRAASSYSHSLDRLRFLKQRWIVPIVINDLAGSWKEEQVWIALSDLAEALVELATIAAWEEFSKNRTEVGECPVMVVGFGKLGGRELNFSSDIDLVYAIPDGLGEQADIDATRFCEMLGRALSDRMGRGSIYRIDLRLRPYGSSGPLVSTMRGFESYYRLYAEQWEIQALIRSKPICGPANLVERWNAMRKERCFRPQLSEPELESMLAMKTRIEERSDTEDIKRGAGGIRDVEFLVQALQLIHGHQHRGLQASSTLEVLRELEKLALVERPVAESLERGYVYLRQLEHRCQLVGDLQTHSIPHQAPARERLARIMGKSDWHSVEVELEIHRQSIQTLYRSTLNPKSAPENDRDTVAAKLGSLGPGVLQWFDSLPSSDAFYSSLVENQDSMARVERIAVAAPRLINEFKASVGLSEMLLSGEIEEEFDHCRPLSKLEPSAPIQAVADTYSRARTHVLARWALQEHDLVWGELSGLADALVRHCAARVGATFDIVALGSYGGCEMGFDSDADLLFLIADSVEQAAAEVQAQQFLAEFGHLKRCGVTLGVDLRLRPDGGKGMLVRSHEALDAYELSGMEMWERFALGQARLVVGRETSISKVRKIAFSHPLTPEALIDLLAMKRRMETERVMPQHQTREVKLGFGGLNDIEWLVHLLEMESFEAATSAGTDFSERIRSLSLAGRLNLVECETLLAARRHLLELRLRLSLLGFERDIVPENPDKLDRLAKIMDFPTGHQFLGEHERTIDSVRSIYLQVLERLKA